MEVAPPTFGAYGGDLIVPDELSGNIIAVTAEGTTQVVARSGLPSGGDIGVESAGFVPVGFLKGGAAYLADRATADNAHAGTDSRSGSSPRGCSRKAWRRRPPGRQPR